VADERVLDAYTAFARRHGGEHDGGRQVLDREACDRLDERRGMLVAEAVRAR
jgi:hypothetical protein